MIWTKRQALLASLVWASSLAGAIFWTPLLLGLLLPRFLLPGSSLLGIALDLLLPTIFGMALLGGALLLPPEYFNWAFLGIWLAVVVLGWRTLWSGSRYEAEASLDAREDSLFLFPR